MLDRTGQQLGNYRLIRVIARGGFAEVYLGQHVKLGTNAAIKVLHTVTKRADLDQFLDEARRIANLKHPNIVRILDFGEEGYTPYLVMDYAENGTLYQRHHGAVLDLPTILPYVRQIADALQFVHSQKIVHCDVKPKNMLLGSSYEVLLSDFGIAVAAPTLTIQIQNTQTLTVVGTPEYMAPEQLKGNPVPASDQYALAIVVYEWLCGSCPFTGTPETVAYNQRNTSPEPLRSRNPAVAIEVENVVLKALAKDSRQRYPNVQAFAAELERAGGFIQGPIRIGSGGGLDKTTFPLRPPAPAPPRPRKPRRFDWSNIRSYRYRPLLVGGLAGDFVASAVLGIISLVFGLGQSWWWVWLLSLLTFVIIRLLRVSAVSKRLITLFAVVLAGCWGIAGWVLGMAIESKIRLVCIPPAGVVALLVFAFGIFIHYAYARRK